MISLTLPDHARWQSWLTAMDEFDGAVLHGFSTFGFEVDALREREGFDRWLAREVALRTDGRDDLVPATVWWIVDDAAPGTVLGSLHVRHELNDFLLSEGGHIGYGVRPSARGHGVASAALALGLREAQLRGIDRALLVCDSGNPASRRTIEKAGGVLEDVRGRFERYWIDTRAAA